MLSEARVAAARATLAKSSWSCVGEDLDEDDGEDDIAQGQVEASLQNDEDSDDGDCSGADDREGAQLWLTQMMWHIPLLSLFMLLWLLLLLLWLLLLLQLPPCCGDC
jgi:hypothetical protein